MLKMMLLQQVKIQKLTIKISNKTLGDTTPNPEDTSTGETQDNTTTPTTNEEETFKKSDIYLSEKNVVVDYVVDGNLFIWAESVTIKSQIGGDAFIIAKSITIEEEGSIYSNLFAISENLEIKGVAYDVYASAKTSTISGYIYRDLKLNCADLILLGTVSRNAFVNCNSITFTKTDSTNKEESDESNGKINGNLNYSSKQEISIPEETVLGEINYTKLKTSNIIMPIISTIILTIIIWFICMWMVPKFINKSQELIVKKSLPVIGFGLISSVALILISIILIILNVTASVGLIVLLLLALLLAISTPIFVIAISYLISKKLKMETKLKELGIIVVVSIVLSLVKLIPFIGSLIGFISWTAGLGLIIYSIYINKFKKTK